MAAAVQWATQRGVPLAVKCGGHGGARWAPGALLLDLGRMRSVYVDPGARVAVVDGGARARDVDAETALHGLAAPLGVCSAVGVGGLALHGGLSLLSRAVGAVCDNILEATLVTADGAVVRAAGDGWRARAGASPQLQLAAAAPRCTGFHHAPLPGWQALPGAPCSTQRTLRLPSQHVVSPGSDPELFWALRGAGATAGGCTPRSRHLPPTGCPPAACCRALPLPRPALPLPALPAAKS